MNWGTFWDAFTAVGTVAMAVTTGLVIRQNRKYHRDASRPICVLVPDEGQDAVARRGIVDCHEGPNSSAKYFRVKASVKNIGCGPALHLRLAIRFQHNSADQPQAELAPLGTNEQIASSIKIPIFLRDDFNRMDYEVAPGEVWELRLTYEDVFGNVFHTRHSKNPQLPWTVLGKGEPLN